MTIIAVRIVFAIVGLLLWLWSQKLLARRHFSGTDEVQDFIHDLTAPIHRRFLDNPKAADFLLFSSSLLIDILGCGVLLHAIFGATIEPLLGLFALFFLRQLNQAITLLPIPKGMIWRNPGFPSILVTYDVSRDMFFSGHTALATFCFLEVWSLFGPVAGVFAGLVFLYEVAVVIILRAHWTMDVFAGAVTSALVFTVTQRLAPAVDLFIANLFS